MKFICPTCNKDREISKAMSRLIESGINTGNCKSCSLKGNKYRLGQKITDEAKAKMRTSHLGKKKTPEHCANISKGLKGREVPWQIGERNYRWIKDRTKAVTDRLLRNSSEWKAWRKSVFERDNYSCKECNASGIYLESHHITPVRENKDIMFDINNGITLCRQCHIKTIWKESMFSEKYYKLILN